MNKFLIGAAIIGSLSAYMEYNQHQKIDTLQRQITYYKFTMDNAIEEVQNSQTEVLRAKADVSEATAALALSEEQTKKDQALEKHLQDALKQTLTQVPEAKIEGEAEGYAEISDLKAQIKKDQVEMKRCHK